MSEIYEGIILSHPMIACGIQFDFVPGLTDSLGENYQNGNFQPKDPKHKFRAKQSLLQFQQKTKRTI